MKKTLVCGGTGFIGSHLVKRLKDEGYWVLVADWKNSQFNDAQADEFIQGDLSDKNFVKEVINQPFDEVYQLAADMGGAGFIFSGDHDSEIMRTSAAININVLNASIENRVGKIFYSSSACIYPEYNQLDPDNPKCSEDSAYPAQPDSEYGWEKLFSERLYLAANRNYGLSVRIARFHNIFGPECAWRGGREKAPAAICRKVAEALDGGTIEIWGDGKQTRSFLYIDECLEGVRKLMESDFIGPVNIGSEEMVTINELADITMRIAGKKLNVKHISGPLGVRGRNSDNKLLKEKLGWAPEAKLVDGIEKTYNWINAEVSKLAIEK